MNQRSTCTSYHRRASIKDYKSVRFLPCAGEIIDVCPGSFACARFDQIENVFAIDGVRAKGEGLRLE